MIFLVLFRRDWVLCLRNLHWVKVYHRFRFCCLLSVLIA